MDLGAKVKYLQTPSVTERLRYLVEDVKAQKILQDIDAKIEEDVRNSINDQQKEYY